MTEPAEAPTGASAPLSEAQILRLVIALAQEERETAERRRLPRSQVEGWNAATPLDETGAGFDSIARLSYLSRVAEFFGLREIGSEDYLTLAPDFGAIAQVVVRSFAIATPQLTFRTSGTTGTPKRVRHALATLLAEAGETGLLPGPGRIVSLVRPQHIYGFLFTVLAPALHGRPLIDARHRPPGAVLNNARPGDVVVGTPPHWHAAFASSPEARGVWGITAGGPAAPALWAEARSAGLAGLCDVYGATETGGIGRRMAAESFTLLPHLSLGASGSIVDQSGAGLPLQDRLTWTGPRQFALAGRQDRSVSVAGETVAPAAVSALLESLPATDTAEVVLGGEGAQPRLEAHVTVVAGSDPAAVEEAMRALCALRLPAAARPIAYNITVQPPKAARVASS
ncbi:MAG: AMP-binding protein [Pseudomonadota bacterium]